MIGVNTNGHTPVSLKKVMVKEKINWRTFADQGGINRQWNLPMTPSLYVIDHRGVIRRKWVGNPGEKPIDAALKRFIQEAEQAASR